MPRSVSLRDLKKGDRVLLQELDNTRYVAEITSAKNGSARCRRIGLDGNPAGKTLSVKAYQLLALEGEPIVKHGANLVPGDLIYTPEHKSGLQYAKVVFNGDSGIGFLRWDESKQEWLKHPQKDYLGSIQWFAHESDEGAIERFFAHIAEDRKRWLDSPGRSRLVLNRGSDEYSWQPKERRWHLNRPEPTYFRPQKNWHFEKLGETDERDNPSTLSTIRTNDQPSWWRQVLKVLFK